MKFLLDANISFRVANWLNKEGFEVEHVIAYPQKQNTTDSKIREICDNENRTLITQDSDFFYSSLLANSPQKLIMVTTGNITNKAIFELLASNLKNIILLLEIDNVIEINLQNIKTHTNN